MAKMESVLNGPDARAATKDRAERRELQKRLASGLKPYKPTAEFYMHMSLTEAGVDVEDFLPHLNSIMKLDSDAADRPRSWPR